MSIPIIYCDKKEVNPNDKVTLMAQTEAVGVNSVWEFTNSEAGDIIFLDGTTIYDSVISFKCTKSIDPLIIRYSSPKNIILNGVDWISTVQPGVIGDHWDSGLNTQTNTIENDLIWGFNGNSQRAVKHSNIGPLYIHQGSLEVNNEGVHQLSFRYRSSQDMNVQIGSHSLLVEATDNPDVFPIFPIQHHSGVLSFAIAGGGAISWIFANGTFSNDNAFVHTNVSSGTSYLVASSFDTLTIESVGGNIMDGDLVDIPSGVQSIHFPDSDLDGDIDRLYHITTKVSLPRNSDIYGNISNIEATDYVDLSTNVMIIGDLGALSGSVSNGGLNHINLNSTGVTGDIESLAPTTNYVNLGHCNVYGNVGSLVGVSDYINIENPDTNFSILGNIYELSATDTIILNDCNVDGEIARYNIATHWELDRTSLSFADLTGSIYNIAGNAITFDVHNGYFKCKDQMPLIDVADPDNSPIYKTVKTLEYFGWTMILNMGTNSLWDSEWAAEREWWVEYYQDCYWRDSDRDWYCGDEA